MSAQNPRIHWWRNLSQPRALADAKRISYLSLTARQLENQNFCIWCKCGIAFTIFHYNISHELHWTHFSVKKYVVFYCGCWTCIIYRLLDNSLCKRRRPVSLSSELIEVCGNSPRRNSVSVLSVPLKCERNPEQLKCQRALTSLQWRISLCTQLIVWLQNYYQWHTHINTRSDRCVRLRCEVKLMAALPL